MKDSITLSPKVSEALSSTLGQDFCTVELLERMAWIVLILRKLPDSEKVFPHGKWATIQSIEGQLDIAARDEVILLGKGVADAGKD